MEDLLLAMLADYGLKEFDGPASNPEIITMGEEMGIDVEDDSTLAWCSLALNYYAKTCGYEYSNSLSARSWLQMPIKVLKPTLGDIVVLWRENPTSWKGHVGLFISMDDLRVYILGGNQGNMISIAAYPKDRILGIRKLHKI
jgi:uncharacterized protein (TIGR02594 family)